MSIDTSKARIERVPGAIDEGARWQLWIPPRGRVDYEGGDAGDGAQLDSWGTTYWPTQQAAIDHLDLVCKTARTSLPPPTVVCKSGDGSWTVEILFAGQPVFGLIYDVESDPLLGELLGRKRDHDPKLVVFDNNGEVMEELDVDLPKRRADWWAMHRAHLQGEFYLDGPLGPPRLPVPGDEDVVASTDPYERPILMVGQLREMLDGLPDETHVVMADPKPEDGWYTNIEATALPRYDEAGDHDSDYACVTFFAGDPFDGRQF